LGATDFTPWVVAGRSLRTLEPAELAREGVRGHNIIRYRGTYYALPQSAGAFIPEKADGGAYREALVYGADLEDVVRRVRRRGVLRRAVAFVSRRAKRMFVVRAKVETFLSPSGPPELVQEGIRGYNIVCYGDLYYAISQSEGAFATEKADSGAYRRTLIHGPDPAEVVRRIQRGFRAHRLSEPPELVQEGIRGYNIVRYGDVYYAILQSEGAFVTEKADSGEYRRALIHGLDPDEVARRIRRGSVVRRLVNAARRIGLTAFRSSQAHPRTSASDDVSAAVPPAKLPSQEDRRQA